MKKLLKVLLILAALAILGVAIFLATFDADRYRPLLVQKLEGALGQPVRLQRISLGLRGGLAFRLQGLSVLSGDSARPQPALEVRQASAVASFLPLLRGQLQIGAVSIEGLRAEVVRTADGGFEVAGLAPPKGKPAGAVGTGPAGKGGTGPAGPVQVAPLLIERLEVSDGSLKVTDLTFKPPLVVQLEDLNLKAAVSPSRLHLKRLTGRLEDGTFSLAGTVEQPMSQPEVNLQAKAERIPVGSLLPATEPGAPRLQGRLSGAFAVGMKGKDLSADGQVRLEEARLENLNILRELFARLTVLPGLVEALLARLPESYRQKLEERDTVFKPIQIQIRAQGEEVSLEGVYVATDSFELGGSGRLRLADSALVFPARIRVEPQLSAAMIRSVEELKFLADDAGRIELPIVIQGRLPQVAVLPDLEYVARQLISSKGQELVGDLLRRLFDKGKEEEERP